MSHPTQHPAHWTVVQCAAYDLVHGYRYGNLRGAPAIAPAVGKSAALLSNEVNPDYQGAKLGLDDAIALERAAGSAPILHAHAQMLHHVCIPLPDHALDAGDVALLTGFADWRAALGHTCELIRDALADGKINEAERRGITEAGYQHMARFLEFLERVETLTVRD